WYGDVAIARMGDGAALFVWSQERERFGLFAVRLASSIPILTSPPPIAEQSPPSLRLRFVPGVGVRALVTAVAAGRAELSLHDLTGRLVARVGIESAAGSDWLFPGTERLASGLYFARATCAGVALRARVAVVH